MLVLERKQMFEWIRQLLLDDLGEKEMIQMIQV